MNSRVLLCLALLACNPAAHARIFDKSTPYVRERLEVYTAALEHLIVRAELTSVAIQARTIPFHVDSTSATDPEDKQRIANWHITGETWDDFRTENRDPTFLDSRFRFRLSIPSVVVDTTFTRFDYDDVHRGYLVEYPDIDGLVFLSGVGLNRSLTEGLVAMTLDCGARCDYMEFLRLVKNRGQWVVAEELLKRWS